jgi:hypothetical protein
MKISIFPQFCAIDGMTTRHYICNTSLLFVSTAGRGAASLEAALAFFIRSAASKEVRA